MARFVFDLRDPNFKTMQNKDDLFKTHLSNLLEDIGAKKQFTETMYIFDGRYIDVSEIKNMKDLAIFFYNEGAKKKVQEIKNVLNIVDPRM
jgi:hypothetical protein